MANERAGSLQAEHTVFRKSLSMLFQKSSFIAQNYPSYLCRKVFWDSGHLVEICRKKDMPQKHAGPGAQALIVIHADGELEWWVGGELLEKTSIRQISDGGQSSGIREQWLKRFLNLLGEQYEVCPGIGLFDGEDISRCSNTTEKLYPFRRTVAVNCASWINKDIERCVPCSKEYETVRHFLQQQGKLSKDNNEEQVELKMSSIFDALEDFPHLACRRISHESSEALEIKVIVGDINIGPPGKQFSLQLSRIVILKSWHMKMFVVNEVVHEEQLLQDGTLKMDLLLKCLSSLGKGLSVCPGVMEHTFGVSHVSYKPFHMDTTGNEENELKQYAILTCKRTKQWMNVSLIISSLFDAKYPLCEMANMLCQCQGCYVILQQMKDKWPDVFQLFINSEENDLDDIVQQNTAPDSSKKDPPRADSVMSCESNPVPICITPDTDSYHPSLSEYGSRILKQVGSLRSVSAADNSDTEPEVTSSTILKEIKTEQTDNLSPQRPTFPDQPRINPDITAMNTPNFPADLNDLLGIYVDLLDQYPNLIYHFEARNITGQNVRGSQALVIKRLHGDITSYHQKFHPTIPIPLTVASLYIFLDGTVEFNVSGRRKFMSKIIHGTTSNSREAVLGYLSLLRGHYTFCAGVASSSLWRELIPDIRPEAVPNLIPLDRPFPTFLDENCTRWFEYKEPNASTEPEVLHRCGLCQALFERLQYTQSIISAGRFGSQAAAPTLLETQLLIPPQPVQRVLFGVPPMLRSPQVGPHYPDRLPRQRRSPAANETPPLQPSPRHRSLPSSPPHLQRAPAAPLLPASDTPGPASQTLQQLCSLVKNTKETEAVRCDPSPRRLPRLLPKPPEHTLNESRSVSANEYPRTIAIKRPLRKEEDVLEYRGIKLRRPVLRIRRLRLFDLPPAEQRHLQARIKARNEARSRSEIRSEGETETETRSERGRERREIRIEMGRITNKGVNETEIRSEDGNYTENCSNSKRRRDSEDSEMTTTSTTSDWRTRINKQPNSTKRRPKRNSKNVKCMKCEACLRRTGCGKCDFCLNPDWKQKCRLRQCPFKSPYCVEKESPSNQTTRKRREKECGVCDGCLREDACEECNYCLGKGDRFRYDKCEKRVCWDIVAQVEMRELAKFPGFMDEEDSDDDEDDVSSDFL